MKPPFLSISHSVILGARTNSYITAVGQSALRQSRNPCFYDIKQCSTEIQTIVKKYTIESSSVEVWEEIGRGKVEH